MEHLISPYGEELVDLMVDEPRAEALKLATLNAPAITLSPRQICDLELLLCGAFSPLQGFLNQADYTSVLNEMRLTDGTLWPMPIMLDTTEAQANALQVGQIIALRDTEGFMLATLTLEECWAFDPDREAEAVFGTRSIKHPGVAHLKQQSGSHYLSGKLEGLAAPIHYDFADLRQTPREVRQRFAKQGWSKVVAFQTRNPMHRAHYELTVRAARELEASLLIHPVVGMTKPNDVDHYTRVHCYKEILDKYPAATTALSLLPLAMRMGGPREALWHALIRRNYGCSHFIVGRDHAGPGQDENGNDFYGPYDAQEMVTAYQDEIGIEMVPFKMMVYLEDEDHYVPITDVKEGARTLSISGTELRRRLAEGQDIPAWFSFPEVVKQLRRTYPPRSRQGFTVFFTGLSGSGKSTIANALMSKLLEHGGRAVTLLDGDIVRTNLSSELGFSKAHRDINVQRIGYVASEITKNGGVAICAPIAPYTESRRIVRSMVETQGGFIEVHVATPLEVCEQRDRKGLYAKARSGQIPEFTGISDPYEAPEAAELVLDTSDLSVDEAVQQVLLKLEGEGYFA
ncbi:MAG: bifunctional sulfate adenylyltransferase/adenylylsulfate kinase [Gammaproteobacteria bacterium]|nr:bifunctional sulfate adenylyltransferase/adenylylsulfate kinase [Gammaproteobacteria bacterium]